MKIPLPLAALVGCALFVLDSGAHAEQSENAATPAPPESGPELGARIGYATSYGRLKPGRRIRNEIAGAIPLWLDVGYRIDRDWFVGAYGQYGIALQAATSDSKCPDCQYSWVRFGAQAQYHFNHGHNYNLWVGAGIGRDVLNVNIDEFEESSRSTAGWELLNLQFGSELHPSSGVALGPYFSFSLGTYDEQTDTCLDEDLCPITERNVVTELSDSGIHGWVSAGVRLVLLP